jgi:hypothetical protein
MSERSEKSGDITLNVTRAGVVVALMVGAAGILSPWFVFPYRIEAAEKRQEVAERRADAMERELSSMRDVLIRIDENVKVLKESQRRIADR